MIRKIKRRRRISLSRATTVRSFVRRVSRVLLLSGDDDDDDDGGFLFA